MTQLSTHKEDILTYPYGQFLMLRPEFLLICKDEIEAKILRIVESWMQQGVEWVSLSYRQFMVQMFGTVKNEKTIIAKIKSLLDKHFLKRRANPSNPYAAPQYSIDRETAQKAINELPHILPFGRGVPVATTPPVPAVGTPSTSSYHGGYQKWVPNNIDSLDILIEDSIEYVLPPYDKGYEGTPSPDTHTHDTLSQLPIATEATNTAIVNMATGSLYTTEEQAEDFRLDIENEIRRELAHWSADLGLGCEDEHDEEEAVEQMSTDVDKQASDVDKDKPSNREVTQESEGTDGYLSSQHHSGGVGPQHDLAHHPGDDTRSSPQAVRAAELIAAEARAVYPMPEMQKPVAPGGMILRAAYPTTSTANRDAPQRKPTKSDPVIETTKGKNAQKDIPSRAQKVGNGGKKAAIPEPSAEAKVVIERWQAVFWQLFQKRILVNASMIEAAELLAPLDLSVEELIDLRAFGFRSNPEWYRRVGMCLMDCYKNVEKWRSLQGDTSGRASKEEDSETFYGYPIITEAWMERRRVSA